MKKCLLVISVMCVALLAGCGKSNRVLTCTKQLSSTGVKMVQTATVNFIGDKIDTMNTTILATLPDSYKSLINTFVTQFEKQYEKQYGDYKAVKVKTTKLNDSEIEINIDFDYKSLTDSEKTKLNMAGSEDYDVNKKTLEKSGFTCK